MKASLLRWPAAASLLAAAGLLLSSSALAQDPALLGPHMDPLATPEEACIVCHDDAVPPNFPPAYPFPTGWGSKANPASASCYLCHDAAGGIFPGFPASNMVSNAYDDVNGSHAYVNAYVPEAPEGSPDMSTMLSGLPYADTPELECTTCHDPHDNTNRAFLRAPLGDLCCLCHMGRSNDGGLSRSIPGMTRSYSSHPTQVLPGGTARANIKTAAEMDANLRVPTPPPAGAPFGYALGGHLDGPGGDSGMIDCGTCHAVHGPTMGTAGLADLLAIDNNTEASGVNVGSALCEGCHFGGAAGDGSIPSAGVGTTPVGPGEFADHPLDDRIAFSFLGGSLTEPPLLWTFASPNLDRGAQPFLAPGPPACSSCHDLHGGIEETPLLRGPAPGLYGGVPGPWAFDSEDWCFSCHTRFDTTPVDENHADPMVVCGGCHGADGPPWTAHNGFWTTIDPGASSGNDVIFDFGAPSGVWSWRNNGADGWAPVTGVSPEGIAVGDFDGSGKDDVLFDFGSSHGVWVWYDGDHGRWAPVTGMSPESVAVGDFDGSGRDDVLFDFGPSGGVYGWYNNDHGSWAMVTGLDPEEIAVGDFDGGGRDDVLFDFGASNGVYAWYNNDHGSWAPVTGMSPEGMAVGDLDDSGQDSAVLSFATPAGVWSWSNGAPAVWAPLSGGSPEAMVAADLDTDGRDEVVFDFGADGVWVRYNNDPAGWAALSGLDPSAMTVADLDRSGQDDLVVDYGPGEGIWAFYDNNPASWSFVSGMSAEAAACGDIDGL